MSYQISTATRKCDSSTASSTADWPEYWRTHGADWPSLFELHCKIAERLRNNSSWWVSSS